MKYLTRRFSKDRSKGSTGERIGAATKVVGLGTAATLGAGYGISKGASAYLGNKSQNLNYDLLDSFMNKGVPGANNKLLETGAKKAALEGSQGIANHLAKKAGKGALIAGGVGLGGMLAQKYYRNKKNQKNFAATIGKLARGAMVRATKSPGAAVGATSGSVGLAVSSTINPALALNPWVSTGTVVGRALNKWILPRKTKLYLAKKSRQLETNPEAYRSAGLPVPKASRVGSRVENFLDNSWLGGQINPRLRQIQEHKAVKKLGDRRKQLADRRKQLIDRVSSGFRTASEKLLRLPLPKTGSIMAHI